MKTYGEVDVQTHVFLTSALVGGKWSASRPGRFSPWEIVRGTHGIGGWMGPRTGLEGMEWRKLSPLPGLELRTLGSPTRNQSLYRLTYPVFPIIRIIYVHIKYTIMTWNDWTGWSRGKPLDLNLESAILESHPGYQLSWVGFSWFLSIPTATCRGGASIMIEPLPSKPLSIHHSSSYHLTL
jgi:hypothetical protein